MAFGRLDGGMVVFEPTARGWIGEAVSKAAILALLRLFKRQW